MESSIWSYAVMPWNISRRSQTQMKTACTCTMRQTKSSYTLSTTVYRDVTVYTAML